MRLFEGLDDSEENKADMDDALRLGEKLSEVLNAEGVDVRITMLSLALTAELLIQDLDPEVVRQCTRVAKYAKVLAKVLTQRGVVQTETFDVPRDPSARN